MFRRILVPVDGSPGSERAVPYARDLAKALDAEVIVCYVVTAPAAPNTSSRRQEAAPYIEKVASSFRSADVPCKTEIRRGEAASEIKRTATDWNVDAIVMATRSRKRFEKLMLGSVADEVVRESRLPVLLVSSRKRRSLTAERAA